VRRPSSPVKENPRAVQPWPPPVYTDGVETRHGGGTKSTKFTTNTKKNYFGFVIFVIFVIFVAAAVGRVS
jgi:hypothetical protein